MKTIKTVILIMITAITFGLPAVGYAQNNQKDTNLSTNGKLTLAIVPSKRNVLDKDMKNLIDHYNSPKVKNHIDVNINNNHNINDSFKYNIEKTSIEMPNTLFLDKALPMVSNEKILDTLTPEDYMLRDRTPDDNSPFSRLSSGVDRDDKFNPDIVGKISGALIGFISNSLTRNILAINLISEHNTEGIGLQIRPIRNVILKYDTVQEIKKRVLRFEMKILSTDKSSFTVKTSNCEDETKAELGFQMQF